MPVEKQTEENTPARVMEFLGKVQKGIGSTA